MNRRTKALSRTFRGDSLLQKFYLDGVAPTGKKLGKGSYGSVTEVLKKKSSLIKK